MKRRMLTGRDQLRPRKPKKFTVRPIKVDKPLLWVRSPSRKDLGKPAKEKMTNILVDQGLLSVERKAQGRMNLYLFGKLLISSYGTFPMRYKLLKATHHCYNCSHARVIVFQDKIMEKSHNLIFSWKGTSSNRIVDVKCTEKHEAYIHLWYKPEETDSICWKKRPIYLKWRISEPTPGCLGHDEDITFGEPPKKRVRHKLPAVIQIAVWERDEGRCVQCGSIENLEFDHIIPLSKGGANTISNIQILCSKCNLRKSDRISGEERQ